MVIRSSPPRNGLERIAIYVLELGQGTVDIIGQSATLY